MTGYSTSLTTNRVRTGEYEVVWSPRTMRAGRCGVILLHQQGQPLTVPSFMYPTLSKAGDLAAALTRAGIPAISAHMGGDSWANATAMTAIDAAWTVLKADHPTMRTDKVCLLGISMGGALAARYTQLHPEKVAAVVGIIPAYDPKAAYLASDNTDAEQQAAWGFSGIENYPSALDLAANAAAAHGVPILSAYASDDVLITPASVTAYHSAVGGQPANLVNVGPLGHTNAAIGAVPAATVARFLVANGA